MQIAKSCHLNMVCFSFLRLQNSKLRRFRKRMRSSTRPYGQYPTHPSHERPTLGQQQKNLVLAVNQNNEILDNRN